VLAPSSRDSGFVQRHCKRLAKQRVANPMEAALFAAGMYLTVLLEHGTDRNHITFLQRFTFRLHYYAEKYDYVNGYDEPYLFTITTANLLSHASFINETTNKQTLLERIT